MSLSPFVSFQSQFVTYLLTFPRIIVIEIIPVALQGKFQFSLTHLFP